MPKKCWDKMTESQNGKAIDSRIAQHSDKKTSEQVPMEKYKQHENHSRNTVCLLYRFRIPAETQGNSRKYLNHKKKKKKDRHDLYNLRIHRFHLLKFYYYYGNIPPFVIRFSYFCKKKTIRSEILNIKIILL